MATINLNSIHDFFETGISYCANKLREITPIVPYSFINLKQLFYTFTKIDEQDLVKNEVPKRYSKNIPAYALTNIQINVENGFEKNEQYFQINNGIYYIVLADLVGSTCYLAKYGNEKAAQRIINFVRTAVETFSQCKKNNKAYFLKEVGDSVLFIFTHVSDVVRWHEEFNEKLNELSKHEGEPYQIRTCVHLGEVSLHDANPLCLCVSETFKMEKQVKVGKIVFSKMAASVAAPSLNGSNYTLQSYQPADRQYAMQELVVAQDSKKAPS